MDLWAGILSTELANVYAADGEEMVVEVGTFSFRGLSHPASMRVLVVAFLTRFLDPL